jgi:hypothetical protein
MAIKMAHAAWTRRIRIPEIVEESCKDNALSSSSWVPILGVLRLLNRKLDGRSEGILREEVGEGT